MSLYHETAAILSGPLSDGGNLRTKIFGQKNLKSVPSQVYALALETCKWSAILSEVVDNAEILKHEKKLSPVLSLLLVHDHLLAKNGIALPQSHGLRASIERHKARLASEFTRARIRRKALSVDALRALVEEAAVPDSSYPRWIRINTLRSSLEEQLKTAFSYLERTESLADVVKRGSVRFCIDKHVPDLIAIPPSADLIKTEAYRSGAIILQDKASCFPAYLLDPCLGDGDIIDSCAAPGNKTTHLAAILRSKGRREDHSRAQVIHAFEKDKERSKSLQKMVNIAGSDDFTCVNAGQDFLKTDPHAHAYGRVGALLLDPSCSGSGIVGRDYMPEIHLPGSKGEAKTAGKKGARKRKREEPPTNEKLTIVDDEGAATVLDSEKEVKARLEALSSFQLSLLLHAFRFPAAKKITYSTCSVHAEENEQVVVKALQSDVASQRGWRLLPRHQQICGMREWPVRGDVDAAGGNESIADACIRAHKGDGRGVMGFFVAAFVRRNDEEPDGEPDSGASSVAKSSASPGNGSERPKATHSIEESDRESEWNGFED